MDTNELCPICGQGHVTGHVEQVESEYKGHKAFLPMHYQQCDTCHSDLAGAKDSKLNKRAVIAFRKSVDGLLTGAEICALRDRYKLTQSQAAKLFGGGPVAFSKYENDDVVQSESMDKLLRLVGHSSKAFWDLVAICGLSTDFFKETLIKARSSTSNVIPLEPYRNGTQRGPSTTTLRPFRQERR